jgi:cytosine/adenosine deaminase-related metal-dependent hydrolase
MSTLLVRNASLLATFDDDESEIVGGGLFIRDGFIEQVGPTGELPETADEILDLSGHILLPGLINTHHHFYQTLTRAVPAAQQDIHVSTITALAELALSGCTAASDHLYIFPNGSRLDDQIQAGLDIGLRLQASRGSMSLGESQGGLPPDSVVEEEDFILKDSQRLIEQYHDPNPGSLTQVVLAPCSPFSITGDLMKSSAVLAREYGVQLHTHLAETEDEEQFCLEMFGLRPHSVHVNDDEYGLYARTGCGVAHCPSSNMRLASGLPPILRMLNIGVKVGLGVDGSASNDGSHMLGEVRQAMLLSRLGAGLEGASLSTDDALPLMTARQALRIATRGSAAVLGRDDIGSLEVGKCGDFFAVDLQQLNFAGGLHDPLAALVFCAPVKADYTVVGGKFIVKDGQLQTIDLIPHLEVHNERARRLLL